MKKSYVWFVMVALLCVAGWMAFGQGQRSGQAWEYCVVDAYNGADQAQRALNQYGAQGWELVAKSGDFYYLKRPR